MASPALLGSAAKYLSKVELHVSCKDLPKLDKLSKSDPIMAVKLYDVVKKTWTEADRTECVKNSLNPEFSKAIYLDYRFEEVQKIQFAVYDVDNSTNKLEDNDFLGSMETTLGQVVSTGTLTELLKSKRGSDAGTIAIYAEEVVESRKWLTLQFGGSDLENKDLFSKSDPFLEFHRGNKDGSFTLVHKTEVLMDTLSPVWQPFTISASSLGRGEDSCPIKVICYDWESDGSHDLIGEFTTTLGELMVNQKSSSWNLIDPRKAAKKKQKSSGLIYISSSKVFEKYSFLDYIFGGCQINFSVAIDFTASNGEPDDPRSLHYINPQAPNVYERALTSVGEVCQDYDTDKMFPALGFGVRIGDKVHHKFALNGKPTNPYCTGIQGVLAAYHKAIRSESIVLSGPTNFAPVINHIANFAEKASQDPTLQQQYFVLLILTDGIISDMIEAKGAIIRASLLPMSIIIVGVGDANFSDMNKLDSDNHALSSGEEVAKRDIVQFVPFIKFSGEYAAEDLAREVLAELPKQLTEYMASKNILPLCRN